MTNKEIPDPYDLVSLRDRMDRLRFYFHYLPETETTMDLAKEHARDGGRIPAVFLTDHQTNGIGREDRVWLDKAGASILATGLFRIKDSTIPTFADLVTLHTCSALEITGVKTQIKYPNDLVIGGQKTAGILVVNNYDQMRYLGTSVGIGINVHYSKEELTEYPTDYGATALDLHTPTPNSRQAILVTIFSSLRYLPVDTEIFQTNRQLQEDQNNLWRKYSSLYGRRVQVETAEKTLVRGRVVDTQIGKGLLVDSLPGRGWFNQFDSQMKVRLLD